MNYFDELLKYLQVVYDKRQKNIPLSGWKEELADDILEDWISTVTEITG